MTTSTNSKTSKLALFRQIVAGLLEHFPGQTMALGGTTITVADLVAKLNVVIGLLTTADASQKTWKQDVAAANKASSGLAPTLKNLRRYLQGVFGVDSEVLLDFGLTPEKPPVTTPETAAAAVAKRAATREARHTMGKKQKAAIHGTVAPTTAPAPVAPTAPTPVAAPSTMGGKPTS
jgi:hypothetical protein